MDEISKTNLLSKVASYYTEKINSHGETPQGVDWNSEEGQRLRFAQLAKLFPASKPFSVIDLGCGYGAFYDFLLENFKDFRYYGVDVSEQMINAAQKRYKDTENVTLLCASEPDQDADYVVASGIFNVKMESPTAEWEDYVKSTLHILDRYSRRGFAFNCLTSYSDAEKMRADLYYADPCALFDHCKRRYSRNVALLHDYGLYEFTILARK